MKFIPGMSITGIISVDFRISATGFGVVNWNGPMTLRGSDGNSYNNHTLPKVRGYTPFTGDVSENGHQFRKEPINIDFKKNPLYVSQNCLRHHLFRDHAFDLGYAERDHLPQIIASMTGLLRGFVVASISCKRASPVLIEDFVELLCNGNFEQLGQCGSKEKKENKDGTTTSSNTFFSKTTFGNTEYLGWGSISIEDLQFISLDPKFDRAAAIVDEPGGFDIANRVVEFLKSLDDSKNPQATFHLNYVRKGTILNIGEAGILLNQDAISILVEVMLETIRRLVIRQGKGYLTVDTVEVDYNDSHKMMRIKKDANSINSEPVGEYAVYYTAQDLEK
jgi:hypothetical protein